MSKITKQELVGKMATYPFAEKPVKIKDVRHVSAFGYETDIVYLENGALMDISTIRLVKE